MDEGMKALAQKLAKGEGTHKTDVFGMGGITYQAGEGQTFDHNRPEKLAEASGETYWDQIHGVLKAFQPGELVLMLDPKNSVSEPMEKSERQAVGRADPGALKKDVGWHAATTEYTEFVKWLMNPDPEKRPTAREALEHRFLRDRALPDDQVKSLVKELHHSK